MQADRRGRPTLDREQDETQGDPDCVTRQHVPQFVARYCCPHQDPIELKSERYWSGSMGYSSRCMPLRFQVGMWRIRCLADGANVFPILISRKWGISGENGHPQCTRLRRDDRECSSGSGQDNEHRGGATVQEYPSGGEEVHLCRSHSRR